MLSFQEFLDLLKIAQQHSRFEQFEFASAKYIDHDSREGERTPGIVWRMKYANLNRITPACAGKRSWARRGTGTRWDHPRVRGEKAGSTKYPRTVEGSPTRARGKESRLPLCNR